MEWSWCLDRVLVRERGDFHRHLGLENRVHQIFSFRLELVLTICSPRYLALEQLFLSPRPSLQQLPVTGDLVISAETLNGESGSASWVGLLLTRS